MIGFGCSASYGLREKVMVGIRRQGRCSGIKKAMYACLLATAEKQGYNDTVQNVRRGPEQIQVMVVVVQRE